jgi:hypothetical protein
VISIQFQVVLPLINYFHYFPTFLSVLTWDVLCGLVFLAIKPLAPQAGPSQQRAMGQSAIGLTSPNHSQAMLELT